MYPRCEIVMIWLSFAIRSIVVISPSSSAKSVSRAVAYFSLITRSSSLMIVSTRLSFARMSIRSMISAITASYSSFSL